MVLKRGRCHNARWVQFRQVERNERYVQLTVMDGVFQSFQASPF